MMVDIYIGIDWSGDKEPFQEGIQVAEARTGEKAVRIIRPPDREGWSRATVCDYLLEQARTARVLAGIDCAFAHPIAADGGYYQGADAAPTDARGLWQLIDDKANNAANFYGSGILKDRVFGEYYHRIDPWGGRGVEYDRHRLRYHFRLTEKIVKDMPSDCTPSSTFFCAGGSQVGTGSLAGMRLLHHLQHRAEIWPFDSIGTAQTGLVLIEIFPALYFSLARVKKPNSTAPLAEQIAALNRALAFFDSDPIEETLGDKRRDNDDIDALISAAALRSMADTMLSLPHGWHAHAEREGWIFGVGGDMVRVNQ